jgi:hypothetical protein
MMISFAQSLLDRVTYVAIDIKYLVELSLLRLSQRGCAAKQ